jgi:signal transduction histidine kinase
MATGEPIRPAYEIARLKLARMHVSPDRDRERCARQATRISAEALEVNRGGLWFFRDGGQTLYCEHQYDRATGLHSKGHVLSREQFPTYMSELRWTRAVVADDAHNHPITRELTESYLIPNRITSMLDAPIIRDGTVVGVVCHEHTGLPRSWTQAEVDFASSVADLVALTFEQADRYELQRVVQDQAQQLIEHRKMQALARLARSVAHDMNNLLMILSGTTDNIAARNDPRSANEVSNLRSVFEMASKLNTRLMDFAAAPDAKPTPAAVSVADLVARVEPILRSLFIGHGTLTIEVAPGLPKVRMEAVSLEQILLNLCTNARDAVGSTGHTSVRFRLAPPTDEHAPGAVLLEVADDGIGMDEETVSRVFEPYFTTKANGTGQGLATVYGIIERAGGVILVDSQPNQGARFLVGLPAWAVPESGNGSV